MEDVASSQRDKHVWTYDEDNVIVECLLDMKADGRYLVENGFRSGYLNFMEGYINEKLPGCGIKGQPHIQSRLKTLKSTWQIIYDMVYGTYTSGFGWNPDTKTVTAPSAVWDEYLKSHKKAAPFRFKPWPHFEPLCTIWSRDRAVGQRAENLIEIQTNDDAEEAEDTNMENTDAMQGQGAEPDVMFSEQPSNHVSASSSASRKRRRNSDGDVLIETVRVGFDGMENAFKDATMELANQVRRVAHSSNMADMKTQLWTEVSKVPGFTEDELAKAAIEIASNETLLVMFPTLPDGVKHNMIRDFNK